MFPGSDPTNHTPKDMSSPQDDAALMDAEIRLVARFFTLTLWRIATSAALLSFLLVCGIFTVMDTSAFYILLCLNLLPAVIEPICAPHVRKSTPVLPYLRKKYHYSSLRQMTMDITFYIIGFFLVLWQLNNKTPAYPAAWLHHFPAFLLAFGLGLRAIAPSFITAHIRRKMGC